MYKDFDFNNMESIHNEICKIANMNNENEAIIAAFHFQRAYFAAICRAHPELTGYEALVRTISNIRWWIGNEEGRTAWMIDYLWGGR